jgi:translation initiation factor IF-2
LYLNRSRDLKTETGGVTMAEEDVGVVKRYFSKVGVAAVEVTQGTISLGDTLRFQGHSTQLEFKVDSMQKDNQAITEARSGDFIGIKVPDKVRENDQVLKITP